MCELDGTNDDSNLGNFNVTICIPYCNFRHQGIHMSKTRIRKSIIYKKSEIVGIDERRTLERLIKEALLVKPKPSDRRQNMGSDEIDSGVRRVIGSTSAKENMLFGTVLLYEVGKDVTFVVEDDDAEEFIIESQNPSVGISSEEDKKRREVLQSALYFGVLGNHLVAVQSQALRCKDLESHLGWLLRESTVVTEDVGISLSDEPTEKARKKLNELPVKSVEIGSPIESRAMTPSGSAVMQTTAHNHKLTGRAKEVIQAFLGDNFINSLNLPSDLNDSNLELVLQLRYKRKTTDSGHKALDHIARAMRHADPEDTKVITSSGTTIHGSELKLTGHVTFNAYNGVPDSADLYEQMYNWLEARIAEGAVG